MPYRRTYKRNYRRRNYRRRYKQKPNLKQIRYSNVGDMTLSQAAYSAMKGVNMLKGIINSELKKYDNAVDDTITSTTGEVISLVGIEQGDGVAQREGISILGKYLNIGAVLAMSGSATSTLIRMMVVVDTMTPSPGNIPTLAEILHFTSVPAEAITSPTNRLNGDRFTVLMDKRISLSINGNRNFIIKKYIPLNFHIKYNGTANTDFDKNSIYVVFCSNETTNLPTFSLTSRLAYYDN